MNKCACGNKGIVTELKSGTFRIGCRICGIQTIACNTVEEATKIWDRWGGRTRKDYIAIDKNTFNILDDLGNIIKDIDDAKFISIDSRVKRLENLGIRRESYIICEVIK